MNANELAYEWEHTAFISEENKQECGNRMATMLRQLQAENEELKLKLYTTLTNRNLRTYDGKEV